MYKFKVAQSGKISAEEAAYNLKEQLSDVDACLILYFVSTYFPGDEISKAMAKAFSGIKTVGCTTSGELFEGMMSQNSIVAMAWGKETLKFLKVEVLENIKTDTKVVDKAFESFEESLGKSMKDLDPAQYVGIVLIDGMSGCEEQLNDQFGKSH